MIRLFECRWGNPHFVQAIIVDEGGGAHPPWRPFYKQSLIGKCPTFTVKIDPPKSPPDCFSTDVVFFFSESLRSLCEQMNIPIEFFPIELLIGTTPHKGEMYYLANIRDEVDAIDESNGIYTFRKYVNKRTGETHEHWVDEIQKLVIDEPKAEGHHLFLLARNFHLLVCASQEFQDQVSAKGFTGIDFIDPANWKRY